MAGMILTDAGRELITQALLGRTLTFTKVKIGEGILSGQEEKELTELISPYKEIDITSIAKVGEGLTRIRVAFSNESFPRVVNFREVGVFAKIDDKVEVLYSYENYGDAVESIPADDGINIVEKIIDTINYVDDADNVTAIIDKSAVYATMVDLEEAQSALGTGISELNNKLETLEKQKLNETDGILTPNRKVINLPNKTNLNSISGTGLYDCYTDINTPLSTMTWYYLRVYNHSNSETNNYFVQELTHLAGLPNYTWTRQCADGQFSPWIQTMKSDWKPLPLASGFSTETGENQAMYCDLGDAYMFKGIIWGAITPNIKLFNLNHGYLVGIAGDSIITPSTWINNGFIGQTTAGTGGWIVLSGIAGK